MVERVLRPVTGWLIRLSLGPLELPDDGGQWLVFD